MGLKERLFGAMGTNKIVLTPFNTTGPPEDNAQAVDPVGVDIKMPSPAVVVIFSSFIHISKIILLQSLRVMATSFRTTLFYRTVFSSPLADLIIDQSLISLQTSKGSDAYSVHFLDATAFSIVLQSCQTLNLHRNPRVPCWKVRKGGVVPKNSLAAYKMVPSPPIVTTQSIIDVCLFLSKIQHLSVLFTYFILLHVLLSIVQKVVFANELNFVTVLDVTANIYFSSQILPVIRIDKTKSPSFNMQISQNKNLYLLLNNSEFLIE